MNSEKVLQKIEEVRMLYNTFYEGKLISTKTETKISQGNEITDQYPSWI